MLRLEDIDRLFWAVGHVAILIAGAAVVLWLALAAMLWAFEQVLAVFRIGEIFREFLVQRAYQKARKKEAATTRSRREGP